MDIAYLSKFVALFATLQRDRLLKVVAKELVNQAVSIKYLCKISYVGIVNFNHTCGCQKCETQGKFFKKEHRMSYANLDAPRRTDGSFRCRQDALHHKEYSIIEQQPIDMVKDFTVSDPLHLFDLGIMKKCILMWLSGSKSCDFKLSQDDTKTISNTLCKFSKFKPKELHRSIRTLDYVNNWKGTEFRNFLLYFGMVALKDVLPDNAYKHFLDLCCAVTICSTDMYLQNGNSIELVKVLFTRYIEQYIDIYGEDSISSNVHNLSHVWEDVERFGNLNKASTYPFENILGQIKLRLQSCKKLPLAFISRRLCELASVQRCTSFDANKNLYPIVSRTQNLRNRVIHNEIHISSDVFFSSKRLADKWLLTKSNKIFQINNIYKVDETFFVVGVHLVTLNNFFSNSLSSSKLNIYLSNGEKSETETAFELNQIINAK